VTRQVAVPEPLSALKYVRDLSRDNQFISHIAQVILRKTGTAFRKWFLLRVRR
jgi:hypothetical protein